MEPVTSPTSPPILEIVDLCRSFGGLKAVCDLSVSALSGEITALIGPNGAGKTTAFNLITGIIPVSSGQVLFQGEDITGFPPHRIASQGIGRTFQNIRIFPDMTVLENVMVGLHTRTGKGFLAAALRLPGTRREETFIREEAMQCLEFMEIADSAQQRAGSLAFGKQRILEIARALALNPKLLLLDEPAAGLNSQETIRLGSIIRRILDTGIAILIVEHDMELVMSISHHVIVLDNGRLIARGTPSEIQRNGDVIAAYLGEDGHAGH
jgi:branched-chain amino acid transport system ATP-binding protein